MGKDPKKTLRSDKTDRGRPVRVKVNGKPVTAFMGETVQAALTASGIQKFRDTASGDPRGPFCGMGICYECLVTINGIANRRACMTLVADGMEITLQTGAFS